MDTEDISAVVDHDVEVRGPFSEEYELNAIAHLEEHLRLEFPAVPPAQVDAIVERHYHEYDERPIRDYVFALVEHSAKADLSALASA